MSRNLDLIIDYIYDHIKYGSELTEKRVDLLFQKYSLTNQEAKIVFEEFNELNITITYGEETVETLFGKLCIHIGESKEYRESLLIKWYETNHVESDRRKKIRKLLDKSGYSIINDVPKEIERNKFDFLNDLNLEPLDSQLESFEFNERLDRFNSPVHSNYNMEYLNSLHSKVSEHEQKQKSLDNLVEANKNLVGSIVERYRSYATQSFDEEDMFQHGMMGLVKAAEKFDLTKETQFSTYAVYWIRQAITRAIMDYSTNVRIPVHMHETINRMNRVIGDLEKYLTRTPFAEEIGAEMDLLTPKVLEILPLVYKEISLDSPVGSSADSFLGDFLEDSRNNLPDEKIMEESLKEEINSLLSHYHEREQEIIKMRFGLDNHEAQTLEEIGQVYGVTRERIRQIESKTLNLLRDTTIKERLRDYYEEG